jgi:hypothetical protein
VKRAVCGTLTDVVGDIAVKNRAEFGDGALGFLVVASRKVDAIELTDSGRRAMAPMRKCHV